MTTENHLLRIMEPAAINLLKPHMRTITVEHGDVLGLVTGDVRAPSQKGEEPLSYVHACNTPPRRSRR